MSGERASAAAGTAARGDTDVRGDKTSIAEPATPRRPSDAEIADAAVRAHFADRDKLAALVRDLVGDGWPRSTVCAATGLPSTSIDSALAGDGV
jgi:hypothetical protein